jgi:hypothetical protein
MATDCSIVNRLVGYDLLHEESVDQVDCATAVYAACTNFVGTLRTQRRGVSQEPLPVEKVTPTAQPRVTPTPVGALAGARRQIFPFRTGLKTADKQSGSSENDRPPERLRQRQFHYFKASRQEV